ncbi:hypothetical protein [Mycobacterium sp. ACS4054]|uniref:hypothetical protein n=1 Tax=Mycobacterium sp. ACS4054 TaxID=1834119 RepID=UPI000A6D0065|nr:hypothetical protein [Mycobacterium sp. ACS4054]
MSSPLEPTAEQFAALAARPANEPVVMVNLLKFKTPDGLAAYQRYGVAVIPHLEHAGAVVRYAGIAPTVVVGEGESLGGMPFSSSSTRPRRPSSRW